jgi:hypothetical protein
MNQGVPWSGGERHREQEKSDGKAPEVCDLINDGKRKDKSAKSEHDVAKTPESRKDFPDEWHFVLREFSAQTRHLAQGQGFSLLQKMHQKFPQGRRSYRNQKMQKPVSGAVFRHERLIA